MLLHEQKHLQGIIAKASILPGASRSIMMMSLNNYLRRYTLRDRNLSLRLSQHLANYKNNGTQSHMLAKLSKKECL